MNIPEAITLLRKVRAYRPAMIMDEYTADAWAEALRDVRLVDAADAVSEIGRRTSDWIDPAMIRREVNRIRNQRANANGFARLEPPPFTDSAAYQEWLRDAERRLADGESAEDINNDHTRGPLRARPMRQLIEGAA